MKNADILRALASVSLFQALSKEDLHLIADVVIWKTIPKGTVFIEEGQEGDEAYLILTGLAKVYRISPEGKEIHMAFRTQGEVIGEFALLDEGLRSAHVKALRDITTLAIPKKEFLHLVKSYPSVAMGLIKTLVKRLRENTFILHDALTQQLSDRTLVLLKRLAQYFPNQEITLSHEELADLLGATRPRVTEALHTLEKKKYLRLSFRKITVL